MTSSTGTWAAASTRAATEPRVAIARALLKQPKILIFDEATSALDAETAESFAKTINALKGQVAMLFITHAMPKGLNIDEVIHMAYSGAVRMPSNEKAVP